jgi:hypothetical protein
LIGCDTLIQTGYTYNDSSDSQSGDDPPALAISFLQGPYAYIPGVTYIDVNGNGVYDEGIDIPLTTAYNHKGQQLGIDSLPGAKNLEMTSFMQSFCGCIGGLTCPLNIDDARYRMLGRNNYGEFIDPCNWILGEVRGGVNCADVNPVFMYSGDPVTDVGWINIDDADNRMVISTGPFQLEGGKPVDIILAYSVGRGIYALNSITETKSIYQYAKSIYESNFDIETAVNEEADNSIPNDFHLSQNYPNPFNPTTKIKFTIPSNIKSETSSVRLKVYDVLGNEIAILINEDKSAGSYEIEFNASSLASGIYFYRIQAVDPESSSGPGFVATKKMLLLR